jgi:signal transduction histidine kinase/CheY-like chemotaxis protein/Fe-S-cluster-containing hydrogenase component 2
MSSTDNPPVQGVVTTIGAKCRRCYNCVRSCPAKAIRVQSGQAWVMAERCIGCGNCITVCAQNAKQIQQALPLVRDLLAAGSPVVALLAPSYPAAYDDLSAGQVVAALRALGFSRVLEVGFGAEMVAAEYARLLKRSDGPLIATPCPALVSYVQKYMPELMPNLAPIVSPMTAMARAVKSKYFPGAAIVFFGPCIAKKAEIRDPCVAGDVDAVMTFTELDDLLRECGLDAASLQPSSADEPLPHYGALVPVAGGLLKTAAIEADLMEASILVVEGPDRCIAVLRELSEGRLPARFIDALFCEGCIAGPAFASAMSPLARRRLVTAHVRELHGAARSLGRRLREVSGVDVSRRFEAESIAIDVPTETEIRDILARTNKLGPQDELNCGACGYPSCRDKAIAVHQGLAEPEMCLPYLIDQLQVNLERLSRTTDEVKKAREQAMRAEHLASMAQLASDMAQEISRPLGHLVVLAQLLMNTMADDDLRREDVASIIHDALRCREVTSGLEGFARQREPQWEQASLLGIVDRALAELEPRLSAAGVRPVVNLPADLPMIVADPAQLSQVIVNILTNSLEAFDPGVHGTIEISARLSADEGSAELILRDNGRGIPPELLNSVFQPFVTTKKSILGAGLGLAVAHGIVHAHGGDIAVLSRPGHGTTVTIDVPLDTSPPTTQESVKVLVVDDDPDFLEQHRIMLEAMGFVVVTAERTDEALSVADREIPDAFVLDLIMEQADSGARLARALRRDPRFRRAPVVILTSVVNDRGFEFSRNPREVLEWMRADAWFDKPAPVAELANTLRRLLAGRATPADEPHQSRPDEAP